MPPSDQEPRYRLVDSNGNVVGALWGDGSGNVKIADETDTQTTFGPDGISTPALEAGSVNTDSYGIGGGQDAVWLSTNTLVSNSVSTTSTSFAGYGDSVGLIPQLTEFDQGDMIPVMRLIGTLRVADSSATASAKLRFIYPNAVDDAPNEFLLETSNTSETVKDTGFVDISSAPLEQNQEASITLRLKTDDGSHAATANNMALQVGLLPKGVI